MKKLFSILVFCASLSVVYYAVLPMYNKNRTCAVLTETYFKGNDTISQIVKEYVQELWRMTNEDPKASHEVTQMPATTNKTLGPCPETPPTLVGSLHVDFNPNRTLDEVRKEIGPPLQKGGKYKPPDCISRQKVVTSHCHCTGRGCYPVPPKTPGMFWKLKIFIYHHIHRVVAVIIPFRNRHEHLKHWLYYLHPILMRQQLDYTVYVINQDGEGVFNKAKVMNAGFVEALKEYDYDCFVFSDVDLVPMDDRNLYRCFDKPRHLSVAVDKFNFMLPYNTIFGGVSSLSKDHFLKINGFSNTYWGWGGEDDDIYNRITLRGMSISRPDLVTGRYKMIKHERDKHNERNPVNPGKLGQTKWTMDEDGINSLNYTVKEIVKDVLYTFINVDVGVPPS